VAKKEGNGGSRKGGQRGREGPCLKARGRMADRPVSTIVILGPKFYIQGESPIRQGEGNLSTGNILEKKHPRFSQIRRGGTAG